jgi:predicted nucleic acid-binding protein
MSQYFLESSALAKRYATEGGSGWIQALLAPGQGFTVIIGEITLAEVTAALAKKQRMGQITQVDRDTLVTRFLSHCQIEYDLVPITRQIIDQAVILNQKHKLRAYDSVQLAAALEARAILGGFGPFTFIASDKDLLTAASLEGLAVDDPHNHP